MGLPKLLRLETHLGHQVPSCSSSTCEEICSKFAPGEMAGPMQLLWRPGEASKAGASWALKIKSVKISMEISFLHLKCWQRRVFKGYSKMVSAVSQWSTMKKLVLMNWGIPDIPHFNSNFFMVNLLGMSRRAGNSRTTPCRCGVPNGTRGHVDQRSYMCTGASYICLSIYLIIYLSIYLSVYLSIYISLSVDMYIHILYTHAYLGQK